MSRLSDRAISILFAAFAFAIILWLTYRRAQSQIDDGFYYFKIAEQFARGHGSTFDGVHPTNGYHPLWAFLLIPIFAIFPLDETARLIATLAQGIFLATSAAFFYTTTRTFATHASAIVGALIWILCAYRMASSGTEFATHALMFSVVALVYTRWFPSHPHPNPLPKREREKRNFILGIFLSILFLARVETIMLAFLVGAHLLIGEIKTGFGRVSLNCLIAFGLPLLVTVAVYLIVNYFLVGTLFPISAMVKRAWSEYYLTQSVVYQTQGWLAAKIQLALVPWRALVELRHPSEMIFSLYLAVGAYLSPLPPLVRGVGKIAPFLLYSILNYLGDIIFLHDSFAFMPWYFVAQPWVAALLAALMLDAVAACARSALSRRAVFIAITVLGLGISMFIVRAIGFPTLPAPELRSLDPLQKTALWLKDNTPRDAVTASWNAGLMSFYSERRVINLDGLMNSRDFFEREQYDLCKYWDANRVDFVADYFVDGAAQAPLPALPYYKKCTDQMELVWSDEETQYGRAQIYRLRK